MITTIVHISCVNNAISEVAALLADQPAVSEVYSVTGDIDLVAMVRVQQFEELADVIAGGINKIPGVTDTSTHVAFRTYSRHDLDATFSLGFEENDA